MTEMPSSARLAIAQVDIRPFDRDRNLAKLVGYSTLAARDHQANLVVLPELANIGYIKQRTRDFGAQYVAAAEPADGPTSVALTDVCREFGCWIVAGIAETHPSIPATLFNSAIVVSPDGLAGVYRKAHLAGEEKHYFAPGNSTPIFSTPIGVIGICICYDTFFPELARSYALKGAHWLVCPFNTGGCYDHVDTIEHLAAARAIENKLFVAMCNRVGSEDDVEFSGRSAVADPFGTLLVKLGEDEDLAVVEIDGSLLRKERAFHPVFADRRPDLYSSLVEPCETDAEVA